VESGKERVLFEEASARVRLLLIVPLGMLDLLLVGRGRRGGGGESRILEVSGNRGEPLRRGGRRRSGLGLGLGLKVRLIRRREGLVRLRLMPLVVSVGHAEEGVVLVGVSRRNLVRKWREGGWVEGRSESSG